MMGTCRDSSVLVHELTKYCWNPKPTGETKMEAASTKPTASQRRLDALYTMRDYGTLQDHLYAVAELSKGVPPKPITDADKVEQFRRDLSSQGEKVKSLLKEKLDNPYRSEARRAHERRDRDKAEYEKTVRAFRTRLEEAETEVKDLRQYTGLQSGIKEPIAPAFPFGSSSLKQALQFAAETISPRSTNAKFLMLFASTWSEQVQHDGKPFSLYGLYWWALLNLADALSSPSVVSEHKRQTATLHGATLREWGNFMKARTRWELSLGPAKFLPGVNQSI